MVVGDVRLPYLERVWGVGRFLSVSSRPSPATMIRVRLLVVAVAAFLLSLPAPSWAHSSSEVDDWLAGWGDRVTGHGFLTFELVVERWEFLERHRPRPVSAPVSSSPAPRVTEGNRGMGSNVEQWRPLVAAYFPEGEVWRALCIMSHESGGNPEAKNPRSSAAGLFQFLESTWNGMVPRAVTGGSYGSGAVYDPVANTRAAAWLAQNVGWSQWSPYQRGLCR